MKRILARTKRSLTETVKSPLAPVLCILPPIVMLVLMELLFSGVGGTDVFKVESFVPGIAAFGYTFTTLYIALNVSGDSGEQFLVRILVSPVKPIEYLSAVLLSALPIMLFQTVLIYITGLIFGLPFGGGLFVSMLYNIPSMLFYSACGLFVGVLANTQKTAGPICSIIITGTGLFGGVWMPLKQIGGVFYNICSALPFYNGITLSASPFTGVSALVPFLIVIAYFIAAFCLSLLTFKLKYGKLIAAK